jgi:hypothetical protein
VEQAASCLCGRMKSALYLALHPRGFGSEKKSSFDFERHSLLINVFRCSLEIFCSFCLLLRRNSSRDIVDKARISIILGYIKVLPIVIPISFKDYPQISLPVKNVLCFPSLLCVMIEELCHARASFASICSN